MSPSSFQEEMIRAATTYSLGAPFLFHPDEYARGKGGKREPADLAWLCRDVLFLFNMTGGRKSAETQVQHNIKQLFGWLRAWEGGERLQGRNDYKTFDIDMHAVDTAVLVSVTQAADDVACFLSEDTARMNSTYGERLCVCCVSLPEAVVLRLVEAGASAADMADFIRYLAKYQRAISAEKALAWVSENHERAIELASRHEGLFLQRERKLDLEIFAMIARGLRSQGWPDDERMEEWRPLLESHPLEAGAVFNDMDWQRTWHLTFRLADAVQGMRTVPPELASVFVPIAIPPYRFLIWVAEGEVALRRKAPVVEMIHQYTLQDPRRPPTLIALWLKDGSLSDDFPTVCGFQRRVEPSVSRRKIRSAAQCST